MIRMGTAVLLFSLSLGAGCGGVCLQGRSVESLECSAWGDVTFTSAADGGARAGQIVQGNTCLAADGSCTRMPQFMVNTRDGVMVMPDDVSLTVSVAAGAVGHLAVPSAAVSVDAQHQVAGTPPSEPLRVTSGDLDVQVSDGDRFVATFSLNLQNAAGQTFTVTGGSAQVACALVQMCVND